MKKRKPPVVLASLLVVLIGIAVVINMPKGKEEEGPKLTAEEVIPDGASRPTPAKSDIKARLAEDAGNEHADEVRMAMDRDGSKSNPKTATIFLPKADALKQVPNDSSVQGQWFRDNARANSKEGFK